MYEVKIINKKTGHATSIIAYDIADLVRKTVRFIADNNWSVYDCRFK